MRVVRRTWELSRLPALGGLVTLGLVVAGCGGDPGGGAAPPTAPVTTAPPATIKPSPTQPANAVHPYCVQPDEQAHVVRFTNSEGGRLVGVLLGDGSTGIVLGHQLRSSLCEWMPHARDLAARGYRVLAIDFGGFGASERAGDFALDADMVAAANHLKAAGVDRVVLVGSSMGGTAVLVAAGQLDSGVAAVVSLSGPKTFPGLDAMEGVGQLRMPLFLAAGVWDGGFADAARSLHAAAGAEINELHLPDTGRHGTQLLDDAGLLADLLNFLDRVAPPD